MTQPANRLTATLTHAITVFGPYDLYILVVSVASLAVLAVDSLVALAPEAHGVLEVADEVFCALFLLDFLRNLYRAPKRAAYFLKGGWLDLLSSIPTVEAFRIGRLSRIARIVRLMRAMRSFRAIGLIVSRKRQESALLAAGVVCLLMTVFGSLAVLQFEQVDESNIRTAGDAVWWAFATVTTVGYGDHYPVTLEGRLVAAMLMAAGVGLFGTMSGLVASWFLHSDDPSEDAVDGLRDEMASLRLELATWRAGRERPQV